MTAAECPPKHAFMSVLRLSLCSLALVAPLFAKEEGWSGSHNVGITLATGNSESLRAIAGLEATGRFGEWEILGKASAIYGEDGGVRSNERADALLQVNRDLTRLLYAGLTTEFLYDPLAGIDARFGITPILGMRVLDTERVTLRFEAGPGYIWENRNGGKRGYSSVRLHEALTYHLTEDTKLFQSLTAVLEAGDLDNYLLTAEAGVESRLVGQWSLRIAGKAIHYGDAQAMNSDDLLVTAGFGYNYLPGDNKEGSLESAHGDRKVSGAEWVVTALLGGSYSEGNSKARSINAGLEAKREGDDHEVAAGVLATYGETAGLVSAEGIAADAHYQRNLHNHWFAGVRVDADHDALADLDWRFALSPYLGRKLIDSDRSKLSLEAGPSGVIEQQGGSQNSYLGAYAAVKGEYKLGAKTRLYGEFTCLAESTEWSSYLLTTEAGIDQSITERISLKLIGRSSYDSTPALGRQRHDLQLISALGVTF